MRPKMVGNGTKLRTITLSDKEEIPSTTWAWRRVKITRAPGGHTGSAAAGRSIYALPKRNPREPLTVSVVYRGGQEAWYEFRARGAVVRVPGTTCVHDLMNKINRL